MEAVAEKENKKKFNVKRLILVSCISLSAIGLGVGTGFFLHGLFAGGETNYGSLEAGDLVDNNNDLMTKYQQALKSGADFSTALQPFEAANVAFSLFTSQEHYFAQGIGVADAGITSQAIRSTFVRDGSKTFEESLSYSSFVNLADRMYQENSTVTQYLGTCQGGNVEVGTFNKAGTDYTLDEYRARMGRTVSEVFIYVVSSKTTLTGDVQGGSGVATSFSKGSEGYQIELELDPVSSVINYVKQMKTISSLAKYPSFNYVHLSLELDSKLNLVSVSSKENYYAKTSAGVGSTITGTMRTVYESGGSYAIPELNTPEAYRKTQ